MKTVLSAEFRVLSVALIALIVSCAAAPVQAAPVAAIVRDGITVTLYDEPCALAAVANLPYRATWNDSKRGHFEGCYTVQHHTIVVLYFGDRTVFTAPLREFRPPAAAPMRQMTL